MTNPQQNASPGQPAAAPARASGRSLASAVAVFLGAYLLLLSLAGSQLGMIATNVFAALGGRGMSGIPASFGALLVLQFLFAIAVVVVGLLLGRGSLGGRLVGSILVVVGSILTLVVLGMRLSGLLRIPPPTGVAFQAVFANPWFAVVLIVGIAWLLSRRARLGWLALLGTLVLIPMPAVLTFASVESGVAQILMFALSALVGAGIIAAGRPLRD